jgi:hypothetical protein
VNLRFTDFTQRAFSFLERTGFRLVQQDSTRLQYESDQSAVVVDWDSRSGELNVFIGLRPKTGEPQHLFPLSDLLAMQGVDGLERNTPFQIADENRLAAFLENLAEETQKHAQSALSGDRMLFRRLETFRSAQSETYIRDMELRRVHSEADKAWRNRDLRKLISLYAPIENDLSESERGKLDYARKHV